MELFTSPILREPTEQLGNAARVLRVKQEAESGNVLEALGQVFYSGFAMVKQKVDPGSSFGSTQIRPE